jgi:hypothetical protein
MAFSKITESHFMAKTNRGTIQRVISIDIVMKNNMDMALKAFVSGDKIIMKGVVS